MNYIDEGMKTWVKEMTLLLEELTSTRVHYDGWVKGITRNVYSWSEFVVEMLDINLSDYFLDVGAKKIGFSESMIDLLKDLRNQLIIFVDQNGVDDASAATIIKDPDFLKIVSYGSKVLKTFRIESQKIIFEKKTP